MRPRRILAPAPAPSSARDAALLFYRYRGGLQGFVDRLTMASTCFPGIRLCRVCGCLFTGDVSGCTGPGTAI